jgi:hypothetical protein
MARADGGDDGRERRRGPNGVGRGRGQDEHSMRLEMRYEIGEKGCRVVHVFDDLAGEHQIEWPAAQLGALIEYLLAHPRRELRPPATGTRRWIETLAIPSEEAAAHVDAEAEVASDIRKPGNATVFERCEPLEDGFDAGRLLHVAIDRIVIRSDIAGQVTTEDQ